MSIVILVLAVTLKDASVLVKLLLVEWVVMLVRLMVLVMREEAVVLVCISVMSLRMPSLINILMELTMI